MEEESAGGENEPPNNNTSTAAGRDEKPATDTPKERVVLLSNVSSHVTCGLCKGYLIDAHTVTDCGHSFCRSCILKHLRSSDSCICGNKAYTTLPLLNVRQDRKLQDLVYKLVPNLFKDEMLKRLQFCRACPPQGFDFSEDQNISVCLRLCDRFPPYDHMKEKDICVDKRFLLCPGNFTVTLMEKFVRLKFNLGPLYKVALFYEGESLYPDYTLIDVLLVHNCLQTEPLLINYVVQDQSYTFLRQLKMVENRRIIAASGHAVCEMQNPMSSQSTSQHPNKEKDISHVGRISPNGVSIHIKHKDGMYQVTSPKDTDNREQIMYNLPMQKKKRGRPPKRPPTGVIATQTVKKTKKESVISGLKTYQEHIGLDNNVSEFVPSADSAHKCEPQSLIERDSNSVQITDTSYMDPSSGVSQNIAAVDVHKQNSFESHAHMDSVASSTTPVIEPITNPQPSSSTASTEGRQSQASHPVSVAVTSPVSQPVLQNYAVQTQVNPQSQRFSSTASPQQIAGNHVTMVNSPYQVIRQVAPNMVSSNGVLNTSGIVQGNHGAYTVMPMAMPKIKRKRGRPPKNRSLMGFPGRCSPMPRHFGIPGSPMYALVKKKRGRPPKRKVGLPPVLVVPQSSGQVGRSLQLVSGVHITNNTPVYVDSNTGMRYIQSNNGSTYINAGNNNNSVQYSNNAIVNQIHQNNNSLQQHTSFQSQTQQPMASQNIKQEASISEKMDMRQKLLNGVAKQDLHKTPESNLVPEGGQVINIAPVDTKLEQEGDDSSLISQKVVGDIINKLSDESSSNNASPLPSAVSVTLPTCSTAAYSVAYSSTTTTNVTAIKEYTKTQNVSTTHTVSQSKVNVSPYERQFEHFLQRSKADPPHGQEITFLNPTVNTRKNEDVEQEVMPNHCPVSQNSNVLPQHSEPVVVMKQSNRGNSQTDNMPLSPCNNSLSLPMNDSSDHKLMSSSPTSSPTSPCSDTSNNKDGTPNSKRSSLSSSDLKEQKRHNLNKLTEKLHSIGEKKRPNAQGILEPPVTSSNDTVQKAVAEDNSTVLSPECQQRKSVISTLGSTTKTPVDGVIVDTVKKHEQNVCRTGRQINPVVHPRHNVLLQSGISHTLQGTVPRATHSVMSLPPTSVSAPGNHVGYTRLISNGYLQSMAGMASSHAKNQTQLPGQSNTSTAPQQTKIIDTKTGLIYQPQGGMLPQVVANSLPNGGNDLVKVIPGKNNASKRLVAQKKKQVALQRLNGKNKVPQPPQGPFYVNFFNCPYAPQSQGNLCGETPSQKAFMYRNNGQVKDDDKKMYTTYPTPNGVAESDTGALALDKPLDFSLKKSK